MDARESGQGGHLDPSKPEIPILFLAALVALYALPIAYFLFAGSLGSFSRVVGIAMFALVVVGSFVMMLVALGSRIDSLPRIVRRPVRRSTAVNAPDSARREVRR